MDQYALLKDGVFVKFMYLNDPPEVATQKGYLALPVVHETVDNSTQGYTSQVTEDVVEPSRYVVRTTISDLPPADIAAAVEARKQQAVDFFDTDQSALRALALTLFDTINEVRVLKSQAPLTFAQFKTYVKGKL
jgi:hypothetical protein